MSARALQKPLLSSNGHGSTTWGWWRTTCCSAKDESARRRVETRRARTTRRGRWRRDGRAAVHARAAREDGVDQVVRRLEAEGLTVRHEGRRGWEESLEEWPWPTDAVVYAAR